MSIPPAERVVDYLASVLEPEREDIESILRVATATLSRVRQGTWYAVVMCTDPATSRVVVADDSDPTLADYIRRYIAFLIRPGYAPTTGLSQRVIETGEPILISRIPFAQIFDHTTPALKDWFETEPPPVALSSAGTAVVPMRSDGQIIGTLGFTQWDGDPLGASDVHWMQPIADKLGVVIAHEQMRSVSLDRLAQLNAMQRVAFALASSQDLRLTLDMVLEVVVGRLKVHAADVLVLDENDGELRIAAVSGFHSTSVPDYRLPVPVELPDLSSTGSMSEVVLCESNPIGRQQRRSMFAREGFRMYRAIPLVARRRLVGFLELFHRGEKDTDQEWLAFLQAMGSHAALAIELARLEAAADRASGQHRATAREAADLSRLDAKILRMLADGATNSQIATAVNVSVHTVKFHVGRLLARTGASNRTELARKAIAQGWL